MNPPSLYTIFEEYLTNPDAWETPGELVDRVFHDPRVEATRLQVVQMLLKKTYGHSTLHDYLESQAS